MENIWILDHYANSCLLRHHFFAKYLAKRGHIVTLFAASTIHRTDNNLIQGSEKYLPQDYGDYSCVYIKARNYMGNEKNRILNMIDFAWGVLWVPESLKITKPDVVYATSVHPLTWLSGYLLAKKYGAKFIAETRDLWPETLVAMGRIGYKSIPARVMYSLEKFIYKKADRLIFTFPGGKDYVAGLGLGTEKVAYINNGVDLAEFHHSQKTHVYQDADLDETDTFKVVYAGSMGQANALGYLIEAAEILQAMGIERIKFILFGDGYQRGELERTAKKQGLRNVFFKGRVDKKFIPSILGRADLNVFTGQHIYLYKYGLSLNKMFEYFASGKPTLSNIECGYDMLEQYQCGITVAGGSAESLAKGVIHFVEMTPEKYEQYCKNSLVAARDFDFKELTNKLEEIIKN